MSKKELVERIERRNAGAMNTDCSHPHRLSLLKLYVMIMLSPKGVTIPLLGHAKTSIFVYTHIIHPHRALMSEWDTFSTI